MADRFEVTRRAQSPVRSLRCEERLSKSKGKAGMLWSFEGACHYNKLCLQVLISNLAVYLQRSFEYSLLITAQNHVVHVVFWKGVWRCIFGGITALHRLITCQCWLVIVSRSDSVGVVKSGLIYKLPYWLNVKPFDYAVIQPAVDVQVKLGTKSRALWTKLRRRTKNWY